MTLCEPRPVVNKLPKRTTGQELAKNIEEQPFIVYI